MRQQTGESKCMRNHEAKEKRSLETNDRRQKVGGLMREKTEVMSEETGVMKQETGEFI